MTKLKNQFRYFGIMGVVFGIVGIVFAFYQSDFTEVTKPPPKPERTLKELALEASKALIKNKWLGGKKQASVSSTLPIEKPHNWVQISYIALGLMAIIFGAISWIRKENIRVAGVAVSFGLMAVAWQYVFIAVGVAVLFIIISSLG
ncbi:hypothetical protein MNBD_GAMMA12-3810 [hydrothermal vent metagenome]|uniref:Uncharacterized protein n=1 Tax=hydrothermal vent metagenome TaxID=652676 RepID=A0A3B0Y7I1_9ZZZZ